MGTEPLVESAYNNSYQASIKMVPFEALTSRRCRSPVELFEIGETNVLVPDLVQDALEKMKLIRERLIAAQNRQKAYADNRHHDLEFVVRDMVFWKVLPMKGCMRFGEKEKLSLKYIGPYEILERVGNVAYSIALLTNIEGVPPIFHVSILRKYLHDLSHVIVPQELQLDDSLTYEEELISILDRQVKRLRSKEIPSMKVLWRYHSQEEATWEAEEDMWINFPHLFES